MSLFSRRIVLICRTNCNARFESSLKSTVASDSTVPSSHSLNKSHFHFPWRERPDVIEASWIKKFAFDLTRSAVTPKTENSCIVSDNVIIDGAARAFSATLNGIFQHNLVENVCLKQSKEEKSSKESLVLNKDEVPLLNDFLESKLAQFYENAVLKCSINRQDLGYMLIAADSPIIVDREIIIGSCRNSSNVTNLPHAFNGLGVAFVVDGDIKYAESFEDVRKIVDKAMQNGFVSVRYWLDISCEEIFFVQDKQSGSIVQGSTDPQQVTHQLLLENSFEFDFTSEKIINEDEWSIVDIDNWMKGNKFWVDVKIKSDN